MTEMSEACIQAGTPGKPHQQLEPFVGSWKSTTKHWMDPAGEPQVQTGRMTNTWILGRRYLRQDYRTDSGDFEGTGYWGYNNLKKRYEGLWIDSMSTGMMLDQGDVDASGKVWTMTGEVDNPAGGTMTKRSVITLRDRNRHTMEMYFAGPDGVEFKAMQIDFVRA